MKYCLGIEGLSRPDHLIPPAGFVTPLVVSRCMGVARKRVKDQDGVRPLRVQHSVRLVGNRNRAKFLSAGECERLPGSAS